MKGYKSAERNHFVSPVHPELVEGRAGEACFSRPRVDAHG